MNTLWQDIRYAIRGLVRNLGFRLGRLVLGIDPQQPEEIGLRTALGASRAAVLGLVVRQRMSLLVAGLAAGLVLSLALMWVLSSLLYAVRPYDPVSLAAAAAALALVALLACSIPAWRTARVDPLVALRYE